jgi:hypothetical protein
LASVAVAYFKQRTGYVHRQEQRGAGHQVLVIQVTGVNTRRPARNASGGATPMLPKGCSGTSILSENFATPRFSQAPGSRPWRNLSASARRAAG